MMTPEQHMEHMGMMEQKMKAILDAAEKGLKDGDASAWEQIKQLAREALGEEQKEKQMEAPKSFEQKFKEAYKAKQSAVPVTAPEKEEGM